jgi:hypothetical protein
MPPATSAIMPVGRSGLCVAFLHSKIVGARLDRNFPTGLFRNLIASLEHVFARPEESVAHLYIRHIPCLLLGLPTTSFLLPTSATQARN